MRMKVFCCLGKKTDSQILQTPGLVCWSSSQRKQKMHLASSTDGKAKCGADVDNIAHEECISDDALFKSNKCKTCFP